VKLPRKKYARTIVVSAGAFVGAGVGLGLEVGLLDAGSVAGAEGVGSAVADGAVVGAGDERSGVASSEGASTDEAVVGGGVAGEPSAPLDGLQAAATMPTTASRMMSDLA
jgi:hypothetical protein